MIRKQLLRLNFKQQATVLAITVSTLPVLAVGGFTYKVASQALIRQTETFQRARGVDLQRQVYTFMQDRKHDIQVMAGLPNLTQANLREQLSRAEQSAILDRLMEQSEVYNSIGVFDLEGNVIAQTTGIPLGNHLNRTYIQAALEADGAVLSQPTISTSSGTFSVYAASVIQDDETGEPIGFVRARMPVDKLHGIIRDYQSDNIDYYLINRQGEVFLNPEGSYVTQNLSNGEQIIKASEQPTAFQISDVFLPLKEYLPSTESVSLKALNSHTDTKTFLVYNPALTQDELPALGWQAVVSQDYSLVLAAQRRLGYIILAGTSLAAILVGAIAAYLSSKITTPILSAANAVHELGEGSLDTRVNVQGPLELQRLGTSINAMAEKIQHLLAERAEQYRELVVLNQQLEKEVQERFQAEESLRKSQAQLVHTEKMSSLGQLVAGVAHEINNPVNFIYGNISHASNYSQDLIYVLTLYQKEYPDPSPELQTEIEELEVDFLQEDFPKLLDSMKLGANRIREIVKSLRVFSRLDEAEFKVANVHEGIDSTLMILQNRLKAKPEHPEIQIVKDYAQLPLIECYPGQLNQVFMNLLSNAIDALDDYNRDRTYQQIKDDPCVISICTKNLEDGYIAIHIRDNGPGIPTEIQNRLFDPFFTTKAVGKGTGLGLSISHQIVTEKHHGRLRCHSVLGQGTEFVIEVPIRQAEAEISA